MSTLVEYPLRLSETAYAEVAYRTNRGRLTEYSIALMTKHGGLWHTVRVYDNAHGLHDIHRHTLTGGKQRAETFHHGSAGEAYRAALREVRAGYEEMIAGWLS